MIECIQNFSQKGNDYLTRKENVREKYKVKKNYDIKNKTILFIDDVYTTGSTVYEITKILYEAGAKNVLAVVLSVNQPVESSSVTFHKIPRTICDAKQTQKFNNKGKTLFFGCNNYQSHKSRNPSLSISDGLEKLIILNQLERKTEINLNDEY